MSKENFHQDLVTKFKFLKQHDGYTLFAKKAGKFELGPEVGNEKDYDYVAMKNLSSVRDGKGLIVVPGVLIKKPSASEPGNAISVPLATSKKSKSKTKITIDVADSSANGENKTQDSVTIVPKSVTTNANQQQAKKKTTLNLNMTS